MAWCLWPQVSFHCIMGWTETTDSLRGRTIITLRCIPVSCAYCTLYCILSESWQTKHIKCLTVLKYSMVLLHQCCLQGVTAPGRQGSTENWTQKKVVIFKVFSFVHRCTVLFVYSQPATAFLSWTIFLNSFFLRLLLCFIISFFSLFHQYVYFSVPFCGNRC